MASPTHTLTNLFPGDEFGAYKKLQIRFTTGQSFVEVSVGLDRAYSFPVTAAIYAYSSETPGTGFVDYDTAYLGNGPNAITHLLGVYSGAANIRSAVIEFTGASPGQAAYEVIDNLVFSTAGPACITDTQAPSVQITSPATDGKVIQTGLMNLAFSAQDNETGIASVQVDFLDETQKVLSTFYSCGGTGAPKCIYDAYPSKVSGDFSTYLPEKTKTIRVKASDFAGHVGQTDRNIVNISIKMNLWAMGMEITQAIQPWVATSSVSRSSSSPNLPVNSQSMPFVSGKRAVVRVYPGIEETGGVAVSGLKASVKCTDTFGALCPGPNPIQAKTITGNPVDGNDLDTLREDPSKTWNFILPDAWTKWDRKLKLTTTVNAPEGMVECSGCFDGANSMTVSDVEFKRTAPLKLTLSWACVRRDKTDTISNCDHSPYTIYEDVFQKSTSGFLKTYPMDPANIEITLRSPMWVPIDGNFSPDLTGDMKGAMTSDRMDAFFDVIAGFIAADTGKKRGELPINEVYFGIVPAPITAVEGLGNRNCAIGKIDPASLTGDIFGVAAHEIGHSLGRPHASCDHGEKDGGGCESAPDVFPCTHGGICTYGFDTYDLTVIDPGSPPAAGHAHDFMSYGPAPTWISGYTYKHLFDTLNQALDSGSASQSTGAQISSGEEVIWVRGTVSESGVAALGPFYHLPEGQPSIVSNVGAYAIQLCNGQGQVLYAQSFDLEMTHGDPPDPEFPPSGRFFEVLPFSEDVTRIKLVKKATGEVLAERVRSANAPELIFNSIMPMEEWLNDETYEITWEASDPDPGANLFSLVQYSVDGGVKWNTVAKDLQETFVDINGSFIAGSESARVRVLVTDGVNTAMAESPLFVVERKAPAVWITSPSGDTTPVATFVEGERVVFEGNGTDFEDGHLPGEAFSWASSLDGPLGTGRRIDVAGLSPGVHEIVLSAHDSDGETSNATVVIQVTERMNTQPIANAGPDRTSPAGVRIVLDASGSRDADGDKLFFTWSIAGSPPGSHPVLTDPEGIQTHFHGDLEGVYTVQLVVTDGKVGSAPDIVIVTVGGGACAADLDQDGDVDGKDLAGYAGGGSGLTLEAVAGEFGRADCF
jgi:hypothetical protein